MTFFALNTKIFIFFVSDRCGVGAMNPSFYTVTGKVDVCIDQLTSSWIALKHNLLLQSPAKEKYGF